MHWKKMLAQMTQVAFHETSNKNTLKTNPKNVEIAASKNKQRATDNL